MKSFYSGGPGEATIDPVQTRSATVPAATPLPSESPVYPHSYSRARIAMYDAPASAPRVEEIPAAPVGEFIEALSARIYELAKGCGGTVPYTVVRELAENLIHADFAEPVVSILDSGNTIRFADQGPGITDKDRAVLPGFTTAHGEMKRYIRGVGSGLPIVSDFLSVSGGRLLIEDNLGTGAVVTITTRESVDDPDSSKEAPGPASPRSCPQPAAAVRHGSSSHPVDEPLFLETIENPTPAETAAPRLTTRQKQVLALVLESGSAGPSIVSRELSVGLSTAYRDLASLEDLGLISSIGGKRALTERGMAYLDSVISSS